MLIDYNTRVGFELGLAAALKPGTAIVVRWHCLVLRGVGYSGPEMAIMSKDTEQDLVLEPAAH